MIFFYYLLTKNKNSDATMEHIPKEAIEKFPTFCKLKNRCHVSWKITFTITTIVA